MEIKSLIKKINSGYVHSCRKLRSICDANSEVTAQVALFGLGITLIAFGLMGTSFAQQDPIVGEYSDERLGEAVQRILAYIEGSFGALIMVASGLVAILSSAFGQYRAALGALIVAVGAFILRSVLRTFFNTNTIDSIAP